MPTNTAGGLPIPVDADPLADIALAVRNLAGALDYATGALTLSANVTGSGTVRKRGAMAHLVVTLNVGVAFAANQQQALIPAGFRPAQDIYVVAIDAASGTPISVLIGASGTVASVTARTAGSGLVGSFAYATPS